jgi:predicted SnoaL-like aldol condensation-catalyzing enzyme
MRVEEWIDAYRRAWEQRDADAAAALFTEDAEYRTHPFLEPHRGRDGVRSYWTDVTSTQANVAVRMGHPFRDGERVTVEFWTTMQNAGADVTLAGCLLLRFDGSGLCSALREYWFFEEGTAEPHSGWGE